MEYKPEARATREKTARLRALRFVIESVLADPRQIDFETGALEEMLRHPLAVRL